jgi:hypothetical protein
VKRNLLLIAAVAAVLGAAAGPVRAQNRYGWTISGSPSDPLSNTGSAAGGVKTLYLWYYCSDGDGMASAEFDIQGDGIAHIGTAPVAPFLNASSSAEKLLLAVGGCPEGPMVAAKLVVVDIPGTLCIVPSADNNRHVTVDCSQTSPQTWNIEWVGYSSLGTAPCKGGTLCESALEASTWAGVKGMYRGQ